MGKTYLDIVSPHCMLVVGKRGTGKSYTLGVIAEEFAKLEEKHSDRLALILVDTMSVFHSLKKENDRYDELKRMDDFDIEPDSWEDKVRILVPKAALRETEKSGEKIFHDDVLELPLHKVEVHEWLKLFDLELTEPIGALLSKVISELKEEKKFSFQDVYKKIDTIGEDEGKKESLKNLFRMIDRLDIFSKDGLQEGFAVSGKITVLDISYLGRVGKYSLRNLIVSIFAREQMAKRTLYTTVEMQAQSRLIESETTKDITEEYPIIYMLIDEAHLFLPSGEETLATPSLIDWIKLGRHPGLSLILATQEPSALHVSAIRQADIILAHNLTSKDDLDALKAAKQSYMKESLDEIVGNMEYKRGLAMLFDDRTRKLQLCKVRPRHTLHTGIDASALTPEDRV